MKRAIYALSAALIAGCASSLSGDDPGHTQCSSSGECLAGYTCDPATNTCVASGGSSSSSSSSSSAGSVSSSSSSGSSAGGAGGSGGSMSSSSGMGGEGGAMSSSSGGGMGGTGGAMSSSSSSGEPTCDPNQQMCDGACVNVTTDPDHCGSCAGVCDPPVSGAATGARACSDGTCGVACAGAAPDTCPPINGGEACVNLKTDPQFCGDCDTHCPGGKTCVNGACVTACAPGETMCGSTCTNTQCDPNNCGACNNVCPTLFNGNHSCQLGGCKQACDSGFSVCTVNSLNGLTACVNLQTDETHCGDCDTKCGNDQVCVAGVCKAHIQASGCWECGNGNSFPLCCSLAGKTICTLGAACPQ